MKRRFESSLGAGRRHAWRIVLVYIAAGALWILFSDAVVKWCVSNAVLLSRVQSYKGLFFIAITAVLLYFLIRRSEESLRAEKVFTDTALDALQDTFLVFEPQTGRMVRWNKALAEWSGYADDEIAGMKVPDDWCDGEDLTKTVAAIEQVLSDGAATVEICPATKDGRRIPTEYGISVLRDPEGQPQYVIAIGRDINERKEAEEQIKEREQRYRSLIENLPTVCWESNEHGRTTFVSSNVEWVYGYTAQEICARGEELWFARVHPDDKDSVRRAFEDLLRDSRPFDVEYRIRRKDGQWIWLQDKAGHVYEKGGTRYACGAFLDVTARKRAEEELRRNEQQFRTLAENIPGAVYRCRNDADWTMLFMSDSIRDLSGYPAAHFVNNSIRSFGSLIHPEDREAVHQHVQEGLEKGVPYALEYRIIHASGDIRWVYEKGRAIPDASGHIACLDGVILDITDRRRIRGELDRTRTLLQASIASSPAGIIVAEAPSGTIRMVNEAALGIRGQTGVPLTDIPMELHPKHWQCYYPDGTPYKPEDLPLSRALVRGETSENVEVIIRRSDGEERWVMANAAPVYSTEGKVIAGVVVFPDITDRKRTQQALQMSEQRYRNFLTHNVAGIWRFEFRRPMPLSLPIDEQIPWMMDNAVLVELNDVLARMYRLSSREEVVGKTYRQLHANDEQEATGEIRAWIEAGHRFDGHEFHRLTESGEYRWFLTMGHSLVENDHVVGCWGTDVDITARKQAQQALEESERRYHALYEHASEGIFLMRDDRFVECNPRALAMYGCARDQIVGMTPFDLSPVRQPDGRLSKQKAHGFITQTLGGKPQRFEWRHVRADGAPFDVEVSLSRLDLPDETLLLALVRDVSERKRAQEKLMEYQSGLRSLASELSLTEERERRRVASYLHDGPCQHLASSLMKLEALRASTGTERCEAIEDVCRMIDRTVGDLRNLTFDLSPPTLYMLGLEAAIEELLKEELRDKHGIAYEFSRGGLSRPVGEDLRVLLFQSVRELVTNIVKYASAQKVTVTIRSESDGFTVTVRDDGVGFDVNTIGSSISRKGGYGLFSIKERLAYIGGKLDIQSHPGYGSEFSLTTPWEIALA